MENQDNKPSKTAIVIVSAVGVAAIAGLLYWGLRTVTSEETAAEIVRATVDESTVV